MLVKVAAYQDAIQAHLARGRLEAEGIPAFVCHEHHVWAYWLYSLLLGGVKVYVHAKDRGRALKVISAHDGGKYALRERAATVSCPRCKSKRITRGRMSWKAALLTTNFANIPLYFAWATRKCGNCGHEWDLPRTRTYPIGSIAVLVLASAALLFALFVGATCWMSKANLSSASNFCKQRQ